MRAYILIETQVGTTCDVVAKLCGMEGVVSADATVGSYGAIVVVERPELEQIGELAYSILRVPGALRTVTCCVVAISGGENARTPAKSAGQR